MRIYRALLSGLACLAAAGCITKVVYIDRQTGRELSSGAQPEPEVPRLIRTITIQGEAPLNISIPYAAITVKGDPQAKDVTGTIQLAEVVANDAEVSLTPQGLNVSSKGNHPIVVQSASFVVPVLTDVTVHTSQGNITLSGIGRNTKGALSRVDASTSSGSITASDCHDLSELVLASSYGSVTLTSSGAGTIAIKSGQGSMTVRDITGGTLTASASSGSITLHNCQQFSSIEARSSYGNVELVSAGAPSSVVLSSGQGSTKVNQVKGAGSDAKLAVHATSGSITLDACSGFATVDAATSYGNVAVTSVTPVNKMTLKSGQGSTSVTDVVATGTSPSLDITATSGGITVQKCPGFTTMSATSNYSSVNVQNLESVGQLTISSGQGSATAEAIKSAQTVRLSATSGSATARNLTVTQTLSLKTSYGSVTVEGCQSPATEVQSSQGDIALRQSTLGKLSMKGRISSVDWENIAIDGAKMTK